MYDKKSIFLSLIISEVAKSSFKQLNGDHNQGVFANFRSQAKPTVHQQFCSLVFATWGLRSSLESQFKQLWVTVLVVRLITYSHNLGDWNYTVNRTLISSVADNRPSSGVSSVEHFYQAQRWQANDLAFIIMGTAAGRLVHSANPEHSYRLTSGNQFLRPNFLEINEKIDLTMLRENWIALQSQTNTISYLEKWNAQYKLVLYYFPMIRYETVTDANMMTRRKRFMQRDHGRFWVDLINAALPSRCTTEVLIWWMTHKSIYFTQRKFTRAYGRKI